MKILHAADFHLDSPLSGREGAAAERLLQGLRSVPEKIVSICGEEKCDLLLLAGDLFDAQPSAESLQLLKSALRDVKIPVFISPGNHDFCSPASCWLTEQWPENVHIFTRPMVESVSVPELDCRIYGAGFAAMDCNALLDNFRTQGQETYHIGVFHGDPTQKNSPYHPISQQQVADSNLNYLALGHIHKTGSFLAGRTLCAWPGCPMGRGFDELEEKGVLLVTVEDMVTAQFVPLDTPRFYDWQAQVQTTAADAVSHLLPAVGNSDFYRITLTGESAPVDMDGLRAQFSQFPNLELRDRTAPPVDLWSAVGEDSLEGVYFRMLQDALENQNGADRDIITLAAKISRTILDGGEVVLP